MRRSAVIVALAGLAALLGGCVYDPYTGGYYPCCSYGNPAYRYPPAYYPPPQGYPSGPPPAQGYPSGPQPAQGYRSLARSRSHRLRAKYRVRIKASRSRLRPRGRAPRLTPAMGAAEG